MENKLQQILDTLTQDTLMPAKQQAKEIVENANLQKEEIINKAKADAEKIIKEAEKKLTQQKQTFENAIKLAAKQTIDELKQTITNSLFNPAIFEITTKALAEETVIKDLIEVIIKAIEEEKIEGDLKVYISKHLSKENILALLSKKVIDRLQKNDIELEKLSGVKIKLCKQNVTLDASNDAIKELVADFIKEDFRKIIFNT